MGRREEGQMLPILLFTLLATLALGVAVFNVGRAAVLRSEAQTAADAAALAGARDIQRQLAELYARLGVADPSMVNLMRVRAAMASSAARNDAVLVRSEIRGVDVKAWVRTKEAVGRRARGVDSEDRRGEARARARVELVFTYGGTPGSLPSIGGTGASGPARIGDDEWDELRRRIGRPPSCDDLTTLGRLLQRKGFRVSENADFGGVLARHAAGGFHYRCGNRGAIDVNIGGPGDLDPVEVASVDPIIGPLNDLGFRTIWRSAGHYNHLHVDVGRSGAIGGGGIDGLGLGGTLEDSAFTPRLIDWDAPLAPFFGFGGVGAGGFYGGPPDPGVARAICRVLRRHDAAPKVVLAAYEAAIVESGVHNLNYGDRDSLGVFQQRPSQGWGTPAQILDPEYAATQFVTRAIRANRPGLTAGQLAQAVQRSAFPERYDQRASQAQSLISQYCS